MATYGLRIGFDDLPSWMTAAVGEWSQISGTTAPSALKDYSGVALRDDGTGVTLYSAAPGGHSGNYTDNKVQAIVLSTSSPAWSTILAASDTTGTNLGTGGGGSGGDEVMASDGHPTPRHTYTDINWIPEIERVLIGGEAGGQNSEVSTVDHFGFNPATNDWDAQGTWPDRPNYRAQAYVRDPSTGKRWAFYNTGSPNQGYEFNPGATPNPTWTLRTWTGGTSYTGTRGAYAWDSARSQIFHLSGGGWFTQGAGYQAQVLNPATLARTDIAFNSSAAWTDFQANSGKFVGSALAYDADADAFYFYNGNTGTPALTGQGAKVYKITPNETATWDMDILFVSGVTPADESNNSGAYNKFRYIPRWRCLILVVGNQSVYYMRVA
jgi:hypothetical protein